MEALSIVFSGLSAVSVVVGLIVVIRKSGSKDGSMETTLQTVANDVKEIKTDMAEVKQDVTAIKIQNATRDAEAKRDRDCVSKLEAKVDGHDKEIHKIKGAVQTIERNLVIVPKSN
jgi:hypothetical protein